MTSWRALKHFCDGPPQYGLNIPASQYTSEGIRFIRTTDIMDGGSVTADSDGVFISPDAVDKEYELLPGDLLFSRSGSLGKCLRHNSGDHQQATFAGYLVRFRPRAGVKAAYLEYCAQSAFFQQNIAADAISSTISNFNAERYATLRLPWWPEETQRTIVDYLDAETDHIDALIAKKTRLSDQLEYRILGVLDALTSGPTAPLRRYVTVQAGVTVDATRRAADVKSYPYLRVANVQDGWLDLNHISEIEVSPDIAARSTLRPGDVLMTEANGNPANIGRGSVWHGRIADCLHQNHIFAIRPRKGQLSSEFLALATQSSHGRQYFRMVASQVGIATISRNKLLDFPVPAIPLLEQESRARKATGEIETIREVQSRLDDQVAHLRERRQSLITAAVTGQHEIPEKIRLSSK